MILATEADLDAERLRRTLCIRKLREGDMGEDATNHLMEELSENQAALTLVEDEQESAKGRASFEVHERSGGVIETRIGSVNLSAMMSARLRALYSTHNPVAGLLTPEYLRDFARAAFMLLYRYSYVDPEFRRQSYMAPQYFRAIERAFGGKTIDLEAFAAAFNTTVPSYCSLCVDVEAPFGSRGSFFDLHTLEVNDILIQVSPPRIGSITTKAVEHIVKLLRSAPPSPPFRYFVVLTPLAWEDVNELIRRSGFLVWKNDTRRGDKIEYHEVVNGVGGLFPRPSVTVLSNSGRRLEEKASQILHAAFSSR